MRELVYLVATTVDGFIAADSGTDPDFFVFEGPQVPDLLAEFPEMIPAHGRDVLGMPRDTPNARFDTVLMGRETYGIGLKVGITSPYPHLRQLVVSSLGSRPDPAVEVISGDVVERVRALKAEDGADIWLCGGGALAACLAEDIDEFILKVSPVVLGDGVPLFRGVVGPRRLTMTDHRVYSNGFMLLRYRFADV
jgi:dihydrofolate reductase